MKEGIVLAGGFGTRLQSVVNDRPKCMALIAGEPFLKYLFEYLQNEGFTHIVLSLGYKSEVVLDWLATVSYPFSISYVIEREPLGTGGAIKFASHKTKSDSFFVFNGDTFFNVDTHNMMGFYKEKKSDISLALKPMIEFDRYGSVEINDKNRIVKFNEKQFKETGLINGGVYLINKSTFDNLGLQDKFSFENDILESRLLDLNINGFVQDAYFIDIGIPTDYEKANIDFLKFDDCK